VLRHDTVEVLAEIPKGDAVADRLVHGGPEIRKKIGLHRPGHHEPSGVLTFPQIVPAGRGDVQLVFKERFLLLERQFKNY